MNEQFKHTSRFGSVGFDNALFQIAAAARTKPIFDMAMRVVMGF